MGEYQIDQGMVGVDVQPPTAIQSIEVTVIRAKGDPLVLDTCDDGTILLNLTPGTDDHTPPDGLGYIFEVVSGNPPQ
ncbi:MAG: hypothetical protein JJ974_12680, partial [Phycisphaerales bacterium]|nr:hypothetical protein [Phycisphaerales bacterium]